MESLAIQEGKKKKKGTPKEREDRFRKDKKKTDPERWYGYLHCLIHCRIVAFAQNIGYPGSSFWGGAYFELGEYFAFGVAGAVGGAKFGLPGGPAAGLGRGIADLWRSEGLIGNALDIFLYNTVGIFCGRMIGGGIALIPSHEDACRRCCLDLLTDY